MLRKLIAALAAFAVVMLATTGLAFAAVDVNTADQTQLQTIKGIGPAISAKIIAERKNGNFKDWDDLEKRVSGIGDKNSATFSTGGLTVGGASKSNAPMAAPSAKTTVAPKVGGVTVPVPPSSDVNAKSAMTKGAPTVAPAATAVAPTAPASTAVAPATKAAATTKAAAPATTATAAPAADAKPTKASKKAAKAEAAAATATTPAATTTAATTTDTKTRKTKKVEGADAATTTATTATPPKK